jgi:hypothetical protein
MSAKLSPETPREGPDCSRCNNTGWVCEDHTDRPWDAQRPCGGAGMPCPSCNVSNEDNPPRLPSGFQPDETLDDD